MVHMPDELPRLPPRRPALRSVPSTERYLAPAAPAAMRPMPVADEGLGETLRKLWRRRRMIATTTIVIGGLAAFVAWQLPTYYMAEARVLVGVETPRIFNAEQILADVSPDAERVQNEGFVLQSRILAKMVIDKLQLADNPQFNPEIAKPSFWDEALDLRTYLPARIVTWIERLKHPAPATEPTADQIQAAKNDRLIDYFLSHIDA